MVVVMHTKAGSLVASFVMHITMEVINLVSGILFINFKQVANFSLLIRTVSSYFIIKEPTIKLINIIIRLVAAIIDLD